MGKCCRKNSGFWGGLLLGLGGALSYWYLLRPKMLVWGSSAREQGAVLPGDDLIYYPRYTVTRAISIHASQAEVWRWVQQLGQNRGGFYSHDWLESLFGWRVSGKYSLADDLQSPAVGDPVLLSQGSTDLWFEIADIEPESHLVLKTPGDLADQMESGRPFASWTFVVKRLNARNTRLIIRWRADYKPTTLGALQNHFGWEPFHFALEHGLLNGVKTRAEAGEYQLHNAHLAGQKSFYLAGGKTGVLLLHGLTATPAEVRPLAKRLNEAGYTIAAPLLPGHGTHPYDLNRIHWRDWVATAQAEFERLQATCDQVFVGGESTGGAVAFYLAAHNPDVAGVLAYAPALHLTMPRTTQWRMRAIAPVLPAIEKDDLEGNTFWQGYHTNPLRGAVQLLNLQKVTIANLHHIRQPVLVVMGKNDTTVDASLTGEIILQNVQSDRVELHWMQESGHVVILEEEREAVFDLTLQFLAAQTTSA